MLSWQILTTQSLVQHFIVDIIVREELCGSQLLELITELRGKEAQQGCNAPAGLQLTTARGCEDQQSIVGALLDIICVCGSE